MIRHRQPSDITAHNIFNVLWICLCKAMLKLTHSLRRCTRLALDNISYSYSTIVEQFANLSRRGKTCVVLNNLEPAQFVSTRFHLRLLSNIKKRLRVKKSHVNSSTTKKHKQMSDPVQPTVTDFCHEGQFEMWVHLFKLLLIITFTSYTSFVCFCNNYSLQLKNIQW